MFRRSAACPSRPGARTSAALTVIDAELGAGVHGGNQTRPNTLEVLGIDVLINADDAALKDAEKAFKRVRMHVAARPLKFGVVNRFVLG